MIGKIILAIIFLFIISHFYRDIMTYMNVGTFIEGNQNKDDNDNDDTINVDSCKSLKGLIAPGLELDGKRYKSGITDDTKCVSEADCKEKCFEDIPKNNEEKDTEDKIMQGKCFGKIAAKDKECYKLNGDSKSCLENSDNCYWVPGSGIDYKSGVSPPDFGWNQGEQQLYEDKFKIEGGISKTKQQCLTGCQINENKSGNCRPALIDDPSDTSSTNKKKILVKQCFKGCPIPDISNPRDINACVYDKDCLGCETTISLYDNAVDVSSPSSRSIGGKNVSPGQDGNINSDGQKIYNQDGAYVMYSDSKPTDEYQSRTIFNDKLIRQILADKSLVPPDLDLNIDNANNFSRVGNNLLNRISMVRNLDIPDIDDNDKELLGRAYRQYLEIEKGKDSKATNAMRTKLKNTIENVLDSTDLPSSNVNWATPKDTSSLDSTTGMFTDNSNSLLGYGDLSKDKTEKPEGGLCLWKGCEKKNKRQPYDSIWSIY